MPNLYVLECGFVRISRTVNINNCLNQHWQLHGNWTDLTLSGNGKIYRSMVQTIMTILGRIYLAEGRTENFRVWSPRKIQIWVACRNRNHRTGSTSANNVIFAPECNGGLTTKTCSSSSQSSIWDIFLCNISLLLFFIMASWDGIDQMPTPFDQ